MNKNIIVQSQPGSGKTVTYGAVVLEKINAASEDTQAICLTATTEAAFQTARTLAKIGIFSNITIGIAANYGYGMFF